MTVIQPGNEVILSDLYFGELEAYDESQNNERYFAQTYVNPESFSFSSLSNQRNFIIIGRKGSGKTAAQMYWMRHLEEQGFLTKFFSFYDQMRGRDYAEIAKTQRIDFVSLENPKTFSCIMTTGRCGSGFYT